jgi:hypothetical protein
LDHVAREAPVLSHLVIAATALIVSGLTLFSGFGLGTILMPAFALFFPLTVAIAATAVVHPTICSSSPSLDGKPIGVL